MRTRLLLLLVGLICSLGVRCAMAAPTRPAKPELVLQTGHVDRVTVAAFSPDERLLATGSNDGTVKLWDVATARMITTITPDIIVSGSSDRVVGVAFTPDGKTLFTSTQGGFVQRWDVPTGARRDTFLVKKDQHEVPFALSPDGKLYVVLGGVHVYDVASRRKVATLPESDEVSGSLQLIDGGRVLVGKSSSNLVAWDVTTRACIARVSLSTYLDNWSAGLRGRAVALGSAPMQIWELGGKTTRSIGVNVRSDFVLTPDGARVVSNCATGDRGVFASATGARLADVSLDGDPRAISPTGRLLACSGPTGEVKIYTVEPMRAVASLLGHAQVRTELAVVDGGRRIITSGLDRTVKIWDCVAGRISAVIQLPWDGVVAHRHTPMAATLDGRFVATGSWDGSVDVFDASTGKKVWTDGIEGPRYRWDVTGLTFSRDGRRLAAGTLSGRVVVFDAATGKRQLASDVAENESALALAFSPDGRTLAVGRSNGTVDQWDVSHYKLAPITRRTVYAPSSRFRGVFDVAFSPDGRRLAACTGWGEINIWECESDAEPQVLDARKQAVNTGETKVSGKPLMFGNKYEATLLCSVAFSPDATLLATGSEDGTVGVFDLRRKTLRAYGCESRQPINAVAFTPNGRLIVTAGADGTIGLWHTSTAQRLGVAVELDRGRDWVVITPDGLFDGSPGGQRLMEWRIGDKIFALDQFFNDFYTPGLLGRLLDLRKTDDASPQQALAARRSLASLPVPPRVEFVSPTGGATISGEAVTVEVKVSDQGGGATPPRLYLNGHRLPDAGIKVAGAGKYQSTVRLTAGANRLRATAFNKEGTVESRGDEVTVTCAAAVSVKPTLHVIAVGIDKYQNGLGLAFAGADAKAIADFFKPGLFGRVEPHLLVDDKASKQAILATLSEVSKQAAPHDVVLLYLAGHGTLVGEVFYFLPWDARVGSENEIRASGLSSVELGDTLTDIPATKQLLVLDACHAGASATPMSRMLANRDSIAQIRAVQRLSRSSGSFLIAASKAEQYAKEIPELGHGVLTYAILNGLGEKQKPAAEPNPEGQVTVNGLLRFLDEEVPKLTEKYQRGDRQEIVQASTGQDFPLVIFIRR